MSAEASRQIPHLRLGRYLGMTADFWMNLQKSYDLSKARTEISKQIDAEVRPR